MPSKTSYLIHLTISKKTTHAFADKPLFMKRLLMGSYKGIVSVELLGVITDNHNLRKKSIQNYRLLNYSNC